MTAHEYKVVDVYDQITNTEIVLNAHAKEGWELFSFETYHASVHEGWKVRMVFKRKSPNPTS